MTSSTPDIVCMQQVSNGDVMVAVLPSYSFRGIHDHVRPAGELWVKGVSEKDEPDLMLAALSQDLQ
jgi:hypothetical protein